MRLTPRRVFDHIAQFQTKDRQERICAVLYDTNLKPVPARLVDFWCGLARGLSSARCPRRRALGRAIRLAGCDQSGLWAALSRRTTLRRRIIRPTWRSDQQPGGHLEWLGVGRPSRAERWIDRRLRLRL